MLPKLLIVGHGRHGKDTVCEVLQDYGYTFQSSSKFCSELFIFNDLKDKYGYADEEECFKDRHHHRTEWYNMIHNYCKDDLARLGRNLFSENDIPWSEMAFPVVVQSLKRFFNDRVRQEFPAFIDTVETIKS